jgi:hypothetical protein
MGHLATLQEAAVELISKYFGQSTAEIYAQFFSGETDSAIVVSVNEIMVDYIGEEKAKDEIINYMGHLIS